MLGLGRRSRNSLEVVSEIEILIEGVRVRPRIGTTLAERRRRPPCVIDVRIRCTSGGAEHTDDLGDTIDYETLHRRILEVAREREYHLIERLAGAVAKAMLSHERIREVVVTVRKKGWRGLDAFGVCLTRGRSRRR